MGCEKEKPLQNHIAVILRLIDLFCNPFMAALYIRCNSLGFIRGMDLLKVLLHVKKQKQNREAKLRKMFLWYSPGNAGFFLEKIKE